MITGDASGYTWRMENNVLVEKRGATLRIAMSRANKKNALTLAMYDEMVAGLDQAAKDDEIRAVLVTGAPGVFTAGNDLMDFMKAPPSSADTPVMRFLHRIAKFEKPLVAAVDGPAVGVGTTMLCHCDYVIATEQARFMMPFTKLGLVPEGGSSLLLPMLVGRQRAAEYLILGRPFDGKQAHTMGLVNQLVAAEDLDRAAMSVCEELAALPKEAVRIAKRLVTEGIRDAAAATIDREADQFIKRLTSPETIAALTAFATRK